MLNAELKYQIARPFLDSIILTCLVETAWDLLTKLLVVLLLNMVYDESLFFAFSFKCSENFKPDFELLIQMR